MSRIFLSHSSANNAEAVALRDWLEREGWKDEIFLDLDPNRGIAAGERWERRLNETANRCEVVLFLVSKAWLGLGWCLKEFHLAHGLNKQLFGVLIEELPLDKLPEELAGTWQIVRLAAGRDHVMLRTTRGGFPTSISAPTGPPIPPMTRLTSATAASKNVSAPYTVC